MIGSVFLNGLKKKYPDLVIEDLDLNKMNLPEVFGGSVDAKYTFMAGGSPNEESMKSWNQIAGYATEFLKADFYLISTPMWNFSIPYKLKQYIDIIMQAGILFSFSATGVEGLAKNKKMVVVTARGSDYGPSSHMSQFDFQEPYLRAIFGFGGITDITFLHVQPLDYSPEVAAAMMEQAVSSAESMASNF
jgi:FMN-dependent NADH-azoreductase